MKIAILTSGVLPVPAVQGGAVETLVDLYLDYNDRHHLHDMTVYSLRHPGTSRHPALASAVNHYRYIDTTSQVARLRKYCYMKRHPGGYYHYSVEYFLGRVIRQLRRHSYDLIIVENRPGYVLRLRDSLDARFVLHLHNDFLNADSREAKAVASGFDAVVSVSDFITRRVRTIAPDTTRCLTVSNAIDTRRFADARPISRASIGLADDDFLIVYSGRLTREKGILELVQAVSRLSTVIPRLRLLVIGATAYGHDQHPTPFIEALRQAAEPVKERITFTGFIDYREVPSYLKTGDVAVVPSMWDEPFGLTVLEAMAAGLPLIATRSGGIPEICEGIATMVDRENIVENLASAIADLYADPERRHTMGTRLQEHARQFDKDTYARNFFDALRLLDAK